MIDEEDLDRVAADPGGLRMPKAWRKTWTGEPQPNWVRIIRRSRRGHWRGCWSSFPRPSF